MLSPGIPFAYVLNLDPFALRIYGNFGIRWYALAYLAGFYATYRIVRWCAARKLSPLSVSAAGDFVFTAALGTIIGGRLGYCLFYAPELFTQFTSSVPFWGVLALHKGGMASHGGMIGIFIACLWYARTYKLPALHLLDLCALSGPIGVFFGRLANFVNGELVGRPAPAGLPWAVKFPQDLYQWGNNQLQALTPALDSIGVSAQTWDTLLGSPYSAAAQSRIESTVAALISAIQHGNLAARSLVEPLLVARHPSQLYEAFGEGVFLLIALLWLWRRPRAAGFISACFLILYALVRILGEQFRMPDPQIGFQIFGTTRGQLLSAVMILVGGVLLWSRARSDLPRFGGWRQRG